MRRSRVWDGLLLIALGVFLLALNQGWITLEAASALVVQFWPVALIVLGLSLIVFGRGVSFGILLLAALILAGVGLFGSTMQWVRLSPPNSWGSPRLGVQTEAFSEELQDATDVALTVNLGAGRLSVDGDTPKLAEARLDWTSVKPSWVTRRNGTRADITVSQGNEEKTPVGGASLDWELSVNEALPLDLTLRMGAGRVDLDLAKTKMRRLNISVGAGDLNITFPEQPEMSADIKSGASSIDLTVPSGTGLKINASNPMLSGALTSAGLEKRGNSYVSKEFGASKSNLEIDLSTGVSGISISRK